MGNEVRQWTNKDRSGKVLGVAYSVPLPNNGDDNRSRVAWVVMAYNKKAGAYHLYCLEHSDFLCHCAIEAVNYRNNFGAQNDAA